MEYVVCNQLISGCFNVLHSQHGPSTSMVIGTIDLQHSLMEKRTKAISIFMGFYFSF